MTGQIPDEFLYKNERYAIAGISGGVLFDPSNFDLETIPASTACWRGYQAFYNVVDDHLVVDTLYINLKEVKKINGMKPKKLDKESSGFFKIYYPEIMLKLNFTGTILIAKDFIDHMYVHMGFQKPYTYETVFELKFEKGRLVKENDKSELMTKVRDEIAKGHDKPKSTDDIEIQKFVNDSFNLDYASDEE